MKLLVVYASRESGNTRKLAEAIARGLGPGCRAVAAAEAPPPDGFDFIALGFGVYRGWPDGDMRAYMKRCRHKDVGLFMTLGAWPDSEHAFTCLGRAEGLLDRCRVRVKFICQGAYTPAYLERLRQLPPTSPHGWTQEKEARVLEAMKHPDERDCAAAAAKFAAAAERFPNAPPSVRPAEKRAIVAAFFGSSFPEALRAYDIIEAGLRRRNPELPLVRAYTSGMVRKKLGNAVPSPVGALKQLQLAGYTAIDVFAGVLTAGEEYHKMYRDVAAFSATLELRISRPVLSDLVRLRAFVASAATAVPAARRSHESVFFMGHGNRDGRSDFVYRTAAAELARLDPNFHLACVEGDPSFVEVAAQLAPGGKVWLIPFLLVAGDHARHDMAGPDPDSWRSRLEAAGHPVECVLCGLGENETVADHLADNPEWQEL